MANETNINEFGEIVRSAGKNVSQQKIDIPTFTPPSEVLEGDIPTFTPPEAQPAIERIDPEVLRAAQKEIMPEIYSDEKNIIVEKIEQKSIDLEAQGKDKE